MRMSILNTATTEQMGCIIFFFFLTMLNPLVGQRGMYQKDMTFQEIKFYRIDAFLLEILSEQQS